MPKKQTDLDYVTQVLSSDGWKLAERKEVKVDENVYPKYVFSKPGFPSITFYQFTKHGRIGEIRTQVGEVTILNYNIEILLLNLNSEMAKQKWSKK